MAKKAPATTKEIVKRQPYYEQFQDLVAGKHKAALFTHHGPDPDGIGSIMGLEWLLAKTFNIEADGFYAGVISHPQNIALTNLLDPNLRPVTDYSPEDYDLHILLDAIPANAGVGDRDVRYDIVIDHHKEIPNNGFNGLYVNIKAGSACATVFDLIAHLGDEFEDDNDQDSRVATAMLVGISTDTDNLMGDETTQFEFQAWSKLFEFRDPTDLKRIVSFERPKFWIDTEAQAVDQARVTEGVGVVGLGRITGKHRDMISDMSSQMVTWEDVHTAIAFAIVDGDRLEGSVRSTNASVSVPDLCKLLGGKHGKGGGKLGAGAYRYTLAGGGVDEDDDAETAQKIWNVIDEKETKRIQRIIAK